MKYLHCKPASITFIDRISRLYAHKISYIRLISASTHKDLKEKFYRLSQSRIVKSNSNISFKFTATINQLYILQDHIKENISASFRSKQLFLLPISLLSSSPEFVSSAFIARMSKFYFIGHLTDFISLFARMSAACNMSLQIFCCLCVFFNTLFKHLKYKSVLLQ